MMCRIIYTWDYSEVKVYTKVSNNANTIEYNQSVIFKCRQRCIDHNYETIHHSVKQVCVF